MTDAIRAIYTNGQLRLLDPTNLEEGEQVEVVILSERERVEKAFAGMLIHFDPLPVDNEIDEDALLVEIDAATQGKVSGSDAIIEERREGP